MRSARCLAGALTFAVSLAAVPAAGVQWEAVQTTIDLNYTYEQEHRGADVNAGTQFQQKYQLKLETLLTSSLDFLGAISVDLDDQWETDAAGTSRVSPSLELGVKGPQSAAKFTYSGVVSETDQYRETSGSTQYSNSADLELDLTPTYWPELKFKLQEKRDYEEQRTDTSVRTIELQLRDEFYEVLLMEFTLKLGTTVDTLPESALSDAVDWSWKATYKESYFGDVDFEAAYEVKESNVEDSVRGVFTGVQEDYTQSLKTRLKKSLLLSPRLSGAVTWEYQFEQDLLQLEYDYRVENKYDLDIRWDALPTLKVTGEAKRETELEAAVPGADDLDKVTDSLKAAFDYEPARSLRFGGKAERKIKQEVDDGTGGSVDRTEDEQYELTMKHRIGDYWDLTASSSTAETRIDGLMDDRETKLKAGLKLRFLKLTWVEMLVVPTYETSRKDEWDGPGDKTLQSYTTDGSFKFELRSLLLDYVKFLLTHEYGQKITEELDETLSFTRKLEFDETTRLNATIDDLWDDFRLEGEIERKATDTEDDPDPQIVEVTYALKLDWRYEALNISSAFKYTDKEEDDEVEFAAKVAWEGEQIDLSGDYQFRKVYTDEIEEDRRLNLKLSYKF